MISHGLWQRRFGGASDVLGQDFLAYVSDRPEEAESFTVVGVMPANHWPFLAYSEILAPLRETGFPYLGRLAPGIEPKAAAEILTNLVGTHLGNRELGRVTLQPLHERHVAAVRPLLVVLMASSVLVLLIAAGNVGLLLFVRNVRRRRELAIRSVLGAGRGRLLLQLVLEALLLCGAASILALLLAALTLGGLDSLIEDQLGRSAPGGNTAIRRICRK